MNLILGSSSKWRQEVLRQAGFSFDVCSPDIDEKAIRDTDPRKLVEKLAKGDVMYCSGALAIEDTLVAGHVEIEGDMDSVMGLPLTLTRRLIDSVLTSNQ